MAGNAALAQSDAAGALALLDIARTDAGAAKDVRLASGIATDRARAPHAAAGAPTISGSELEKFGAMVPFISGRK